MPRVKETMDPPFLASWQPIAFAALLLLFLTSPMLLSAFGLISRPVAYAVMPDRNGPFSYFKHEIFAEKSELDIVFLGSSLIWSGVDTPFVQHELSKKLGREANVITLGSNWRGEDLNYFVLRDLLEHRKVKMVVLTMPTSYQTINAPHHQGYRWMFYGDEALRGLPLRQQLAIYGENVLGTPRQVLSLFRSDRSETTGPAKDLGALKVDQSYMGQPFTRMQPSVPLISADSLSYNQAGSTNFRFTNQPLSPYQMHFLNLTFALLKQHGVTPVILHIPVWTERHSTTVDERMNWQTVFGSEIPMVGMPPAVLFAGMTDKQIDQLYYDEHLNVNGNEFFTRTITPALLEAYVKPQTTR